MLYIMRRTQLYLEDEVWSALHVKSRESGQTMSELVRQTLREKYLGSTAQRASAMNAFVGSLSGSSGADDIQAQVRSLRKGSRLQRLG